MEYILKAFFLINLICIFHVLFHEHKNISVTWAWLILLILFPHFGFVFYLFLGIRSRKLSYFAHKINRDNIINHEYRQLKYKGLKYLDNHEIIAKEKDFLKIKNGEYFRDLVRLNYIADDACLTLNNNIKMFHKGMDKFEAMLIDIENAKKFIHLEYYIVRNDNISNRLINALAKKAMEGVEVKFLIDKMGTYLVAKKNFKRITNAGGEIAYFKSPKLVNINYRNHRKIAIIDGEKGYIGGLNIGDEYLGKVKRYGHWRDSHISIHGDSVKDLELRFIKDWNFVSSSKIKFLKRYFPEIKEQAKFTCPVQIVSSGPDTKYENILIAFNRMVVSAKKSIYIVTPYFVPDDSLMDALKIASLSGVDVNILIPANPDHFFVYEASMAYISQLLDYNINCYQYTRGFIHSKILIVDDAVVSIGSANTDIRSFKLNFEINSFIYSNYIAKKFVEQIKKDMRDSSKITMEWYLKRGRLFRMRVSLIKLFSPLL